MNLTILIVRLFFLLSIAKRGLISCMLSGLDYRDVIIKLPPEEPKLTDISLILFIPAHEYYTPSMGLQFGPTIDKEHNDC